MQVRHHAAEIRPDVAAGAEHVVGAPARREGVVRVAPAAAILDHAVVASWALHVPLALPSLRVAKALVTILNHEGLARRVDVVDTLVEIDTLIIAAAAKKKQKKQKQCTHTSSIIVRSAMKAGAGVHRVVDYSLVNLDGIEIVIEEELDVADVRGGLPYRIVPLGLLIHAHAVVVVCITLS